MATEEDTCSELTIYKNAVEQTRGSTSSEDDAINTSGEDGSQSPRLDQIHQIFELDIPEKELHRRTSIDKEGGQAQLEDQRVQQVCNHQHLESEVNKGSCQSQVPVRRQMAC